MIAKSLIVRSTQRRSRFSNSNPRRAKQALFVNVAVSVFAIVSCKESDRPVTARSTAGAEKPNVLLISIDTLRADRLGCYGYAAARTPVIDALADDAVVFERAYTAVPITLPAHASMLTGLIPPAHGARDNLGFTVPDEVETLAERMHENGYQTLAFVGGAPLARRGGLAQGFDQYRDPAQRTLGHSNSMVQRAELYADEVFTAALAGLSAASPQEPTFAFIHLYDPHSPYEKPLPGAAKGSYDGEIAFVDRQLGQFLQKLRSMPRWQHSFTVITADHGESLDQHGEETHCVFVYDSTLHIPLIVHWPGQLTPTRSTAPVSIIDIAPTILSLLNLSKLSHAQGVPLLPESPAANASTHQRDLYFESLFGQLSFGWAPLRGIRRGPLKFISAPRPELYDLSVDPDETTNLYNTRPGVAEELAKQLEPIGEGSLARSAAIDDRAARQLASLGYVTAPPADANGGDSSPDPKDRVGVYDRFQHAHELFLTGQATQALDLMASLEDALDKSPYFYVEWGNFAAQVENWPLAAECYQKCLALDPIHEDANLNLAVAHMKSGDAPLARQQFEALLGLYPRNAQGHLYLGVLLQTKFSDVDGARAHWRTFLELAPDDPQADQIRQMLKRADARTATDDK